MDNLDDSDPVIIALNSKIKEPQGYYKTGGVFHLERPGNQPILISL